MSIFLFADNASSLLASGITNVQTTIAVTPTTGAIFSAPGAGQVSAITVEDASGDIEVMYCTGRSTDTLTVIRAQEGTTGFAFASGARVEQRVTMGMLGAFLQKNGGDTLAGTTIVSGVLNLGSSGSIQGGEFTGFLRSGPGVTAGQIFVSGGVPMSGSSVILTSTNLASNLPSGTDLARSLMIVGWFGTAGAVPSGWHICDGTTGTPDMRNQFVVGWDGVAPTSGTYAGATGSTTPAGGTTNGTVLGLNDLPAHKHPFDYFSSAASAYIGDPGFGGPGNSPASSGVTGSRNSYAGAVNTGAGSNAHTHTLNEAAHTHPQAIPYRAVYFIMKL